MRHRSAIHTHRVYIGKVPVLTAGLGLLILSVICGGIALAINVLFLMPNDFRTTYRARQYEQCITQGTAETICTRNYR
jgi:hypothetical protein